MKLGIVIGNLGIGGAERVSKNLADWFTSKGDSVTFFNTKKPAKKEYSLSGSIKRYCCYADNKLMIILNIRKHIKKEKPDVILIMSTPMCVYAIPALWGLGIPLVVSERSSPANAKVKRSTRVLSDLLLNFAQAYVFQTTGQKKYFNKHIRDKGYVIQNPLVVEELPAPYEGVRTKRFVSIGRLVKEKNYPFLIQAFLKFHQLHPDFILEIYGDGSQRNYLQKLIDSFQGEEFIRLYNARNDILQHICDAYGFVLSSELEGMPNALIEAMAIGIPCISTDCPSGGPADLITNNINGILVPVNDIPKMFDALNRLAEDQAFAVSIGKEAQKIRNELDINIIAEKWKAVFISAIHKKEKNK